MLSTAPAVMPIIETDALPLKAHLVVEHEAAEQKRRAEEDDAQIRDGVRQDRLGGAEQPRDGRDEHVAEHRDENARAERAEKAGGGHALGVLVVLRAEAARDVVARAVPEEEADGLDERHRGERDADGRRGLRVDAADEERVGHVVKARDEHADDRGPETIHPRASGWERWSDGAPSPPATGPGSYGFLLSARGVVLAARSAPHAPATSLHTRYAPTDAGDAAATNASCPPRQNAPPALNAAFTALPRASILSKSGSIERLVAKLTASPAAASRETPRRRAAVSSSAGAAQQKPAQQRLSRTRRA